MQLNDFDYHLPQELIAQQPADPRDSARLLNCLGQTHNHQTIADLPDILQQGEGLADAINSLLPLLKTHVLIFHNARLDLMALDSAFKRCGLPQMEVLYIDTLQLALYQLNKQHQVLPSNSATLTVCRQRLDLPAFPEHNALDDALATMQLFYAQLNELGITLENSLESLAHTNAVGRFKLGVPH